MGICCFKQDQQDLNDHTQVKNNSSNLKISEKQLLTGEDYKQQGNAHYNHGHYEKAIISYKKAISKSNKDNQIVFHSNLALAYKANRQYLESIHIIDQLFKRPDLKFSAYSEALAKAETIKARSMVILVKQYSLAGKYTPKENQSKLAMINEAIRIFENLVENKMQTNQVETFLLNAHKNKDFLVKNVINGLKEARLVQYLKKKLKNKNNKGKSQKDTQISIRRQKQLRKYYPSDESLVLELERFSSNIKGQILNESEEQYLTDPITYDYFKNAVLVPSGISYDEEILREHFKHNGYNDPITHEVFQVGEKITVRNHNIDLYLKELRREVRKDDILYLRY